MSTIPPQTDTYNQALDIFDKAHPLRVDVDENLKVTGTLTTVPSGTQTVAISQTGDDNDVDVISSVLPTGAATEATLAATKANLDKFQFDGSGNLKVNVELETPETVTVVQPTGTNLHTVVDSGSINVLNFPATQPVSGTVAATQSGEWDVNIEDTAGNALTSTANALDVNIKSTGVTQPVSGTVTANQGTSPWVTSLASTTITGNVTVVQPTGTNLHTVLDSGTLTSITNALPAGTNVIGHVITDSGSTTAVTGDITVVQPTAANLNVTVTGTVTANTSVNTRSDTYTTSGTGTTVNVSTTSAKVFSIMVLSTGAVASAWSVVLEGSLDNVNFTTILTHNNTTGNGVVLFSGAALSPCLYFRSRAASITLGLATNLVVTILGVEY